MSTQTDFTDRYRLAAWAVALAIGVGILVGVEPMLSDDWSDTLFGPAVDYPVTVQMTEWLAFFLGLGELLVRFVAGRAELAEIGHQFLPEDHDTVLQHDDLMPIYSRLYKHTQTTARAARLFLPRLVMGAIRSYRSSGSIDQANTLLNSSLELFMHEIDLRYNVLRYTVWLIPSLGFIGTVIGISGALRKAADFDFNSGDTNVLGTLTSDLGVAFDTTMLALALSIILVLLMNLIQSREERALNNAGRYCLENLINRLY